MPATTTAHFAGRRIADIPPGAASFTCLALVKPGSAIAEQWHLEKPSYCIYEYTCWGVDEDKHELRWGDGSWQKLGPEDFDNLILLREFGEAQMSVLFDN